MTIYEAIIVTLTSNLVLIGVITIVVMIVLQSKR